MKNNKALELIHSIRNEFVANKFTVDYDQNDSESKFLQIIQTSGESLKGDEKILYNVLKDTYVYNYFEDVSWKIVGRTNLNSEDLSQIETWSTQDFKNYIIKSFKENDLKKEEMKIVSLWEYKTLFYHDENIDYFPTLSDWYLSQKIDFLSDNSLFTKNELRENRVTINAIYDELIESNTGNPKLYFMHRKITDNCRFANYENALEELQALTKYDIEGDYKVIICDEIIDILVDEGKSKEALEIAYQTKQKYSDSPLFKAIQYSIDDITNPTLCLNFEKKTQSNRPIHVIADHKNVSDFILSIYEVKNDFEPFMKFSQDYYADEESYDKIEKKLIRKEQYQLPNLGDYEKYSTSIEIKALPSGIYVAEFALKDGELNDPETIEKFYFIASDNRIIYQNKQRKDIDDTLKLVNNETGKPISNEEVTIFEYISDKPLLSSKTKTDENGTFKFPPRSNDNYSKKYLILQPRTNDYQVMEIYDSKYYEDEKGKDYRNTQIFTDRAIYRPGQIVYFKTINTQFKNNSETTISGLKQKIILSDQNDREISSQDFITNEFGSYHGSFTLPMGKLGGSFFLKTDDEESRYKHFKVEEYKRPKFEVVFDSVKDEYQYGQTLEIKGKAVMFSGVALSNVTVKYEVKKKNITWKYFSWYSRGYDSENSVLGEAETNEKGEFSIFVYLEKDEYLDGIQINNFEINASVTDINGETQSAVTNLKVASVSHYIKAKEIEHGFTDENVKIKVETKNFNDQNIPKSYQAKLVKLKSPDRIFRSNFKEEVQDLPKLSKDEFINKFPYDRFDESELKDNAEIEKIILDQLIQPSSENTTASGILDLGKLEAGDYQLDLYDIQEKESIKTSQKFNIWDKKMLNADQKTFLTVLDPKKEFSRGEKASVLIYSAIPDTSINIYKQYGFGDTITEVRKIENGILEYFTEIPQDKNINTVDLQFQIVAFNDVQTAGISLKIKENETPLEIETTTFRDKIQPNSKEKWSVKIIGKDQEKIYAEVLANMYDLSLDQFAANKFTWQKVHIPIRFSRYDLNSYLSARSVTKKLDYFSGFSVIFPFFSWYNGEMPDHVVMVGGGSSSSPTTTLNEIPRAMHKRIATGADEKERGVSGGSSDDEVEEIFKSLENVEVRENLNETAFFYPDLRTDPEGNINFEFTSPEALTKWKLMFLAHTKDAKTAMLEKEVVTQKEFSVTPNYPRFVREGDELDFQSKLSNLTDKKLSGSASLQILDAFTNEDISSQFGLNSSIQNFDLNENENLALTWKLIVPNNISSIILKVIAKAGQYSDGEQNTVAVLPNRILVTDALPIFVKEGETKTFELENLKKSTSTTIFNISNTLELTTNPIWEIIFALSSLKNDQNNSADVIFNKWFADVLASEIFKANPQIKTVFDEYKTADILKSNLEKNQELKQILLEETPWVLQSESEAEIMNKISRLFEINEMKNSINNDWSVLLDYQSRDGGFPWLPGYRSSYSNSLYILRNLGKINDWIQENISEYQRSGQEKMISRLINYIDNELERHWNEKEENPWSNFALDYLESRHYWEKEYPLSGTGEHLKQMIINRADKFKVTDLTFFGVHRAAIVYDSYGLKDTSKKLINYLKETSTSSETQGVYWKKNLSDWGWYSSKTVNHAGAIEALNKINPSDVDFVEESKVWLITQKEVNSWGNSRATAEVIYIMMNSGKSWTTTEADKAKVIWGGKEISTQTKTTGYLKEVIKSDKIDTNLGQVTVTKPGPGIVQGGLFWQYYEDLSNVKSTETYISMTREYYKKIKTTNGEQLIKISENSPLKVGDRLTVRMILNTDRPMQFVHLKDMRAAGLEPVDVLSGYQWKNNLAYYQATKDASTNFYIYYMSKGQYVFEYDLVCNASGNFSSGFATLQNYYAPQMNARTKGDKIDIKK